MSNKKISIEQADENSRNGIRLNKFLSDSGVCSRREADRLIEAGKIKIDQRKAVMGERVYEGQVVTYNSKVIKREEKLILLALNKPVGIECTCDRNNPDNIIDFMNYNKRIFSIGRLDKNSCGLILMTNDGDLANKIAKSVNCHEKEYIVKVNKKITEDFLESMRRGVKILDTVTRECKVSKIDDTTFRIILTQGLNRQIRRMCEAFKYRVIHLQRVRVMNILLGRLKEGTYRTVTDVEMSKLMKQL